MSGDVTGPRWVGGVNAPMDSSSAEKAWDEYASALPGMLRPAEVNALRPHFMAGRASRGAEVAELTAIEQRLTDHVVQLAAERDAAVKALAESRARFADSEARRAELESVIAKARKHLDIVFGENSVHMSTMRRILDIAPSVVLEDRDREVEARALEDFAARAERMFAGTDGTDKERAWIGGVKAVALRLRQRAAAIRKGDTNA